MLTKNYKDTLFNYLSGANLNIRDSCVVAMNGYELKSFTSANPGRYSLQALMNQTFITTYFMAPASSSMFGVVFGTGNVAPTPDDTTISGNFIDSTKIAVTRLFSYDFDAQPMAISCEYTIANNGSNPITIAEIALFDNFLSSGKSYPYLIDRTVLESPITIAAGGVGKVTYTIELTTNIG